MPDDSLISQLAENTNPQFTDKVETETAGGQSLWLSLTRMCALFLGGRTIGGSAETDIPTNNSSGVQTNKRYNNPKINSDVVITPSGADFNKIPAHIAGTDHRHTATHITALSGFGLGTTVQGILYALEAYVAGLTDWFSVQRLYQLEWTQSGTDPKIILEADILAQILPSKAEGYVVLANVQVRVDEIDGSKRAKSATVVDEVYDTTDNGQMHIDKVILDNLVNGTKYGVTVSCRLYTKA